MTGTATPRISETSLMAAGLIIGMSDRKELDSRFRRLDREHPELVTLVMSVEAEGVEPAICAQMLGTMLVIDFSLEKQGLDWPRLGDEDAQQAMMRCAQHALRRGDTGEDLELPDAIRTYRDAHAEPHLVDFVVSGCVECGAAERRTHDQCVVVVTMLALAELAGRAVERPTSKTKADGLARRTRAGSADGTSARRARGVDVVRLRIELEHIHPPIWREVEVPSTMRLSGVAEVLLVTMGWCGGHLHEFEIDGQRFVSKYVEPFGEPTEPMSSRTIGRVARAVDEFTWTYDFGDDWRHRITVQSVTEASASQRAKLPRCIAGARACPPEDVGGIPGYERMIEAMGNPDDPEHEEFLEWIPANYDPEAFNARKLDAKRIRDLIRLIR